MNGALTVPEEPVISVVMPVHNSEAHLAEAIASIQAQRHRRWELIILDDGSTDRSAAIAQWHAARDERIRPIRLERGGVAAALNAGISLARGELIARMDADDVAVPERFALQIDWMRRTGVEICGSWAIWFGEATGIWWVPESHEAIALFLVMNPSMVHPSVLMHTEIALANLYCEDFVCEDFELWTRLVAHHRMGNVPAVLLRYRRHGHQVSRVEAARIRTDAHACRRRQFDVVFPDADPLLCRAFDHVMNYESCADLAELDRAGELLVRLAQSPERMLREHLLRCWYTVCSDSLSLGEEVLESYRRLAPQFDASDLDAEMVLARRAGRLFEGLATVRPAIGA